MNDEDCGLAHIFETSLSSQIYFRASSIVLHLVLMNSGGTGFSISGNPALVFWSVSTNTCLPSWIYHSVCLWPAVGTSHRGGYQNICPNSQKAWWPNIYGDVWLMGFKSPLRLRSICFLSWLPRVNTDFLGQGSDRSHSCKLHCSCSNAGSLNPLCWG